MRILKQNFTTLGTFLAGVVGHHYVSKLLEYKSEMAAAREQEMKDLASTENMESLHTKLSSLKNDIESVQDSMTLLVDKHVPEAELRAIKAKLEVSQQQCNIVFDILNKGPENMNLEFYRTAYKAADSCVRATTDAHQTVKALVDSLNNSNSFVPNLNLISEKFYEYLNSLSLLELSALYHIIVLILLFIITVNILSAVLGNEIINYFKLEQRFPQLSSFLRIRLKFQRYYLTLSFFLIFSICIASIIINILVLY